MMPVENAVIQGEMPRYKCHKEVWALKIKGIAVDGINDGAWITPEDGTYAAFMVDGAYLKKHQPKIGGYYVLYEGGYKSFSPADVFEKGYTRI